jgi:hypothetical protein
VKPTEAAALLTVAAAYDNRKPDADTAKAWALALDGLRFEDCRDVIVQHYRKSREWLMPVDVIEGVKRLRFKRVAEYPPIQPPPSLDPDDVLAYMRWERETTAAIADGTYVHPEPLGVKPRNVGELGQIGRSVPRRA